MKVELKDALNMLNPRQLAAVKHTEGPVMVIAGPGTGKTQILAARIAHILSSPDTGDVHPSNILCLTYTEAGTIAMRNRLIDFIGSAAYQVGIFTFHGFCNMVIQENPEHFGMREMEPISDLETIQLLRELVDAFPADHPLKRWGNERAAYFEVGRLRELFAIMKKEDWTQEFLVTKIEEYLEDFKTRETTLYKTNYKGNKKGDIKEGVWSAELNKMTQLKAAVMQFDNYRKKMDELGRYDFNDMIAWVLSAFRKNQELILDYQERYQYFLVDEYQDTNGSQNEILHALVSYWEKPNVFVVGDDDQSIFRFQGANIANISDFPIRYQGSEAIVLENNYRSSQHILDLSGNLIARNVERLVNRLPNLTKDLKASNPAFNQNKIRPVINAWYNGANETVGIAQEIELLVKEGVKPGEIAVIYRNHAQSEEIARYLELCGISLNVKRKSNILESPLIDNILKLFAYLDKESRNSGSGDHFIFEIMHYAYFNIKPETIAFLASELRGQVVKQKANITWRQHIKDALNFWSADKLKASRNEDLEQVRALGYHLETWIGDTHNKTLQGLIEHIIIKGGILGWILTHEDRTLLLQEMQSFFNFIKTETAKQPLMNISSFLDLISAMRTHGVSLDLQKSIYSGNGVNFLTAHGSKGLEFEYVFIVGCNQKNWDRKGMSFTYKLPDNITSGRASDETEESRRLFYVAMTRAKKHLSINYQQNNNTGKEKQYSQFVQEISEALWGDEPLAKYSYQNLDTERFVAYWNRFVLPKEKPHAKLQERDAIKNMLDKFQLSVTNLSKYLRCPLSFYYESVLKIPAAKNRAMSFGSAVHYALEMEFKEMLNHPEKEFPEPERMLAWFEQAMVKARDSFTDAEYTRDMEYGQKFIPEYYADNEPHWPKMVSVEKRIQGVVFRDVPIRGALDRIDFNGNDASVVDYKTGKVYFVDKQSKLKRPDPEATEDDDFEKRYGGDYWRQAVFYKILVESQAKSNWRVVSTVFEFVEPDRDKGEFASRTVDVSIEDTKIVGDQIEEAWKGIQNQDFEQGCGEENCRWCNFVRNQYRELDTITEEQAAAEV